MTATLKSHETIYVKNVVPIKGACGAFYLAVTAVTSISITVSNEELAKALADLSKCVMSIQDDIVTLKQCGPTQSTYIAWLATQQYSCQQ